MSSYQIDLWGRIQGLQKEAAQNAGYESGANWYAFQVYPTCPSSKMVLMRGGLAYCGSADYGRSYSRRPYTIPALTANFADPDSIGRDITFTEIADGYLGYVLLLRMPPDNATGPDAGDWHFSLVGTNTEFATPAEVEHDLEVNTIWGGNPWADWGGVGLKGYPLCGIVLRNDGRLGPGCPIGNIDLVPRGGSYLWPRDLRPRWVIGW